MSSPWPGFLTSHEFFFAFQFCISMSYRQSHKKYLQIISFILCLIIIFSCNNASNDNFVAISKDTSAKLMTDESFFGYKISWLDSSTVVYSADSSLTHKGKAFLCDSAIAIDYTGFLGEHAYLPLNNKGQWINTIKKRAKLSFGQLQNIQAVFGDKNSFYEPRMVSCYNPGSELFISKTIR